MNPNKTTQRDFALNKKYAWYPRRVGPDIVWLTHYWQARTWPMWLGRKGQVVKELTAEQYIMDVLKGKIVNGKLRMSLKRDNGKRNGTPG